MSRIKNHKDLEVWKKSISFVKDIYEVTQQFPKDEVYGLTSQIRRASISIPSNIAEGAGRKSKTEFKRFIYIAIGSISEVETQLIISSEINYLSHEKFDELNLRLTEIRKMMFDLIKSL